MPYIPMTNPDKIFIVGNRLRNMNLEVHKNATWLDIQIICHQNGLDITEMLRPQISDKARLNSAHDADSGEVITMPDDATPKKISTKIGKKSMGFSQPKQETDDEYTL